MGPQKVFHLFCGYLSLWILSCVRQSFSTAESKFGANLNKAQEMDVSGSIIRPDTVLISDRYRSQPLIGFVSRHRTLMNIFDKAPRVDKDAFVAPSASIIGDVQVGKSSSIWYGCVLRGDVNNISVGAGTNIQDNALVHVAKSNLSGKVLPTIIGDNVTIGHSAVIHGCTVKDEAFVGMGATLLDGVVVEKNAMVAAGALVRQNTRIPYGEVWAGNPAKFLRKLSEEEIAFISQSATNYCNLAQVHAAENAKTFDEIDVDKMLRKKFARRDEEYDSMLGVVREVPPQLILPDNILPDKSPRAA